MAKRIDQTTRGQALAALERMQKFDAETLAREDDLGKDLNFRDAVATAQRLVGSYRMISPTVLENLPEGYLTKIRDQTNAHHQVFTRILTFSTTLSNARKQRIDLINNVIKNHEEAFGQLQPIISYSISNSVDFKQLESEARTAVQAIKDDSRAAVQAIKDDSRAVMSELDNVREDAKAILEDVRNVAAEQGVSQQAIYFKQAAEEHQTSARRWKWATLGAAGAVLLWAVASLFLHKSSYLEPKSAYDSVQLGISKVLVFGVLSFLLYLSAKHFLAHTHNAIVNRHRQDALLTFTTLADAAKSPDNRDVVLNHAAGCIFSPQPTGYSKDSSMEGATAKSVVELLGKPLGGGGG